nr:type VI secretion system tip protein VgrG [uncultured Psychroserpens sp.]
MTNDRLIPTNGTPSVVTSIIKIDGTEIARTFQVLSIVIVKELNRIPFAKITLKDGDPAQEDFPASNDENFEPGKDIEILVGYEANEDLLFKGVIVKQSLKVRSSGSSMLKLDCRDKAFVTTLTTHSNYFLELTDGEVIEDILGAYDGLKLDIPSTEITHQELVQYETTDWEFINQRANLNGLFCKVSDSNISLIEPDFGQEPIMTLTYGSTILDFDGEIDARDQFSMVKASCWDPANQELLEAEASEPDIVQNGNIEASELAKVGNEAELHLRHSGKIEQDELQSWADSQLLKMRMGKTKGRVKFQGTATAEICSLIKLQGLGDRFNGDVFVSGVRHEIQEGSWNTDVQFGIPEDWFSNMRKESSIKNPRMLNSKIGLQVGVVTQLQDDPDGENRILVKLPSIDENAEGTWARLATLNAGEEYGMFFLPEIGDEVVVGFLNNALRNPVILGSLHSSNKPAPFEASDDNFEKGFKSINGIAMTFNDEKKSLNIETPAGKKIILDEDEGSIQLIDDNSNKIIMDSEGIVIESGGKLELKSSQDFKIEGGINLELKAGANFKAEGSAGAELSTSAIAVLKGSLVQIN